MTLYFDYAVNIKDLTAIVDCACWHSQFELLAVAAHSVQPATSQLVVYNEWGDVVSEVIYQQQQNDASITTVCWHPQHTTLVFGFVSGDIRLWNKHTNNNYSNIHEVCSPHCTSLKWFKWSQLGTRFISVDQAGRIVGWKYTNSSGKNLLDREFQHELNSAPICSPEFCCYKPGIGETDVSSLAKRAVDGDEKALDVFGGWRPRTTGAKRSCLFDTDNRCCYISAYPEKIYYINNDGNCALIEKCQTPIRLLMHHGKRNMLLVILHDASIGQYMTNTLDGTLTLETKVKLNGVDEYSSFAWVGLDLLAYCTMTNHIRFWNVQNGYSYALSSDDIATEQRFTALCYHQIKGLLCGGTNHGNVTLWKQKGDKSGDEYNNYDDESVNWQESSTNYRLDSSVVGCYSGPSHIALLTKNPDRLLILQERPLCARYNEQVCAIQSAPSRVTVYNSLGVSDDGIELRTDLKMYGLSVSKDYIAVWSSTTIAVYQLPSLTVIGTFNCDCDDAMIYEESLIILSGSKMLMLYTFQGTVKQHLQCDGGQAQPIAFHLNSSYLVAATSIGMLHLWDLSRREAKLIGSGKDLMEAIDDFGEVISLRVNCHGSAVSIVVANSSLIPIALLYIWHVQTDTVRSYEFSTHINRSNGADSCYKGKCYVINHEWDVNEPVLLGCEIKISSCSLKLDRKLSLQTSYATDNKIINVGFPSEFQKSDSPDCGLFVASVFVSEDHGIIHHDLIELSDSHFSLVGTDMPFFITVTKPTADRTPRIKKITSGNFDGFSSYTDSVTRHAVVRFGFYFSIGDLDNAFSSISNLNNIAVWKNLAVMCVRRKRLDVAGVCLGKMKDARGVAVLRSVVAAESDLDMQIAALASHLGMLEEAEKLYINSGRYDLLNKLYRASGRWDSALTVANQKDRINLNNTRSCYARYLHNKGMVNDAIRQYEVLTTNSNSEQVYPPSVIPRLLLKHPQHHPSVQQYVDNIKHPGLLKWWAQYNESVGNMDTAMKYYKLAEDYLSIVRILCFLQQDEQAASIADKCTNSAACYHLARHYENTARPREAVKFFLKSNAFANAIRICKDNGLEDELWQISLLGDSREQAEIADYFEQAADYDKAVVLYQKAGNLARALTIAIKYDMADSVDSISLQMDFSSAGGKQLLDKCVNYFLECVHQPDNAVHLLVRAKKFKQAMDICVKYHVRLTDHLADLLTSCDSNADNDHMLNRVAEYALSQANYHLAAKKYTQAGNKKDAMKALLKSGDTDKIIFFANVCRDSDIYVMLGNYLQTVWQQEPHLLKHIVNAYTKAKAPHLLANFYLSCAQVEVDEYRNYEKCLNALNEASNCFLIVKPKQSYINDGQWNELQLKINRQMASVKKFIDLRMQIENNDRNTTVENVVNQCQKFVTDGNIVRKGDLYALMIGHAAKIDNWNAVAQLILEMRKYFPVNQDHNLARYLPKEILDKVGRINREFSITKNNESDDDVIPDESV